MNNSRPNNIKIPSKRIPILFRHSVAEIPTTTYGAFAIYKYPAKFIPQVIAYVLKNFAKPGMKIFDPFAGYGTVGVVSRVYGFDYELWDLNPLLGTIHDTILSEESKLSVAKLLNDLKHSSEEFVPKWKNLEYWFPEEFLSTLIKTWGYIHNLPKNSSLQKKLTIPMINVTRYFSWCDEKVHKLYKSKYSKKKVDELLQGNWKSRFYLMLEKEIRDLLAKLDEYKFLKPKPVNYTVRHGVDTLETVLDEEKHILLTSPPYLQAQEYIRSTKLGLYWLGYDDATIRALGKKEIPYRSVDKIRIKSNLYYECKDKIDSKKLKELYERYFHSILKAITNLAQKISDYLCIFIGPASIRTVPVPIDDIIVEHMQEHGWIHDVTFIDTIVGHVMFKSRINPATGLKNQRIQYEHLAILKKE
ncbi:MAG: hypothetical protein ACFFE8_02330 [Candidatus Heimdallarchaeota archaeon]